MNKTTLLLPVFLLFGGPLFAQTLKPGDVAVIGMNATDPDAFTVVALVDLPAGTILGFTDNGWMATGGFRTKEQTLIDTLSGPVPAGTVWSIEEKAPRFSIDGDQVFVFQGTVSAPLLIYGLNDSESTWQVDASDTKTSALPPVLTDGFTAVAVAEFDNVIYSGPRIGTREQLLTWIGNPTFWEGREDERYPYATSPFQVDGIPSPVEDETGFISSSCRVFPNPFTQSTNLVVQVDRRQNLSIQVRDLLGRIRTVIFDGPIEAGTRRFSLSGESLPAGIYFIHLDGPGIRPVPVIHTR